MNNLIEVADKYKTRRREALQHLISQGLREGVKLDFILSQDIEDAKFEGLDLITKKNLKTTRRDDSNVAGYGSFGYCNGYNESEGLIKMAHLWDFQNNCAKSPPALYYLDADLIIDAHITSKSSPVSD